MQYQRGAASLAKREMASIWGSPVESRSLARLRGHANLARSTLVVYSQYFNFSVYCIFDMISGMQGRLPKMLDLPCFAGMTRQRFTEAIYV